MRAPAPVPVAPKPRAGTPRLGAWRWARDTNLSTGHFTCRWDTQMMRGVLTCNDRTMALIETTDEGTDEFMDAREEAKRTMKAVMRDVSHLASTRPYGVTASGRVPRMPAGIKALRDDVVRLVQDMSKSKDHTPAETAEFASRYGRQRDAMKDLRDAFAEAEGAFETAQVLLRAQMEE